MPVFTDKWCYIFKVDLMLNGDEKNVMAHQLTNRMIERIEDLGKISLMANFVLDEMEEYSCDNKSLFVKMFSQKENLIELYDFLIQIQESLKNIQEIADGID